MNVELSSRYLFEGYVIYQEHLEEASFLYEQRLGLFNDPELNWLDLDDFEERFEAHIDALFLGDDLALAVCKQQATEGDAGELHAAMCVFCRQDRIDLAADIIEAMDAEDKEWIAAVVHAFCHELPDTWLMPLLLKYQNQGGIYKQVLPRTLGFQRRPAAADTLLSGLDQEKPEDAIWALGRIKFPDTDRLINLLQNGKSEIQQEASLALLRAGNAQVLAHIQELANTHSWALLHAGLAGNALHVQPLINWTTKNPSTEGVLALGLLGDPAAVPSLLVHLASESVAEAASYALYLITGATLFEEVFEPEEIDEDLLFDDELEKLKNGEPLYPSGEEPGITYTRISQNKNQWTDWWDEQHETFNAGLRYRNGKPYEPACLLENLKSEKSPNALRKLAYEELVIRYGLDVPFETEMYVRDQLKALAAFELLIQQAGDVFIPGAWYYAGQKQ